MVKVFFKLMFIFTFVLFYSISAIAQNGMNFQGVARNSNNVILASQPISIRLSVLKGTTTGNIEYQETKTINTNAQGLFNLVIGDGTAISGTGTYGNINWQEFPKFIKIEMDANAGNNFITLGTTQLQYVAYAYFANGVAAENIVGLVPVARGGTGSSNLLDLKNNLQLDKVNNTADSLKPLSKAVLSAMLTKLNISDTVNLSNRINNKLNYADTLSLSNRISTKMSFVDTLNMSSRIDGKLNIADTISLSKRIDLKGDLSDGIAALATKANTNDLTTGLSSKVDKVSGKDLSSNDFTTAEKSKLTAITGTNTGDQDLSSYVTSSALALKAPLNNPVFTSDIVVNGLTLGLGGANISNNTVFGKESFVSNTTGHNNVAIGLHSLFRNTTGFENVAIGYAAMPLNVDGSWNVAFGGGAMNSIRTGNDNIAIGGTTLYGLYSGSKNTVIGVAAMHSTSSGESNTAIGYNASGNISTGSYNTVIGAEAKIAAGTFSNSVAIGYNASAHASNTIQLGNTDITNVVTSGVVSATAFTGPLNGNAATATKLLSAKNINGVAFDGSADITVNVDAGTLTGTTLNSTVTGSSLTSVGTLVNLTVTNPIAGSITGSAATAENITATSNTTLTSVSNLNTVGTITSGVWSGTTVAVEKGGTGATTQQTAINAITGSQISGRYLRSDGTNATLSAIQIGDVPTLNQNTTGNALTATTASTVITNANLTGDVTSVGNATAIANNAVVTSKVLNANITYAKIQNVTTTDKVLGRVSLGAGVVEEIATTGTGNVVRATSPVLVTPNIGAATGSDLTTNRITNSGKIITGSSSAASSSAVFEANSTTQGLLLPRMTLGERNAISSPVAGLVIYCTNCGTNGEMEVYDGSDWKNMLGKTRALVIGEPYQGGLLAYILQSGDPGYDVNVMHGLIVSISDLDPIRWYNGYDLTTNASAVAIGTGLANTNTIITAQGAVTTSYAAGLARSHNGGGFTDWYLPSRDEMYKIYLNRYSISGFYHYPNGGWYDYWTSSEYIGVVDYSYTVNLGSGSFGGALKSESRYIRPIRAF